MTIPTTIIAEPNVQLSHHRIHEAVFSMITLVRTDQLVANPKYVLIITPFSPLLPIEETPVGHVIFSLSTFPGATFEIFEDAVVSANGIDIPVISNNRVRPIARPGFVFEDPTVVSEGTRIFIDRIGTTITGGIGGPKNRDEDEIMLKIGTKYLVKITPLIDGIAWTLKGNVYTARPSRSGP